jgi:FkbM family methyltransferase
MNLISRVYSQVPRNVKNLLKDSKLNSVRVLVEEVSSRIWSNKFYSQTGEDVILGIYLPERTGLYVDIGAGRPISGSNTYFLYKRGWKGVCVDPLTSNAKLFKILRPRDKVFKVLISSEKTSVPFWEFEPYGYSTADSDIAQKLKSREGVRLLEHSNKECWPLSAVAPQANPLYPSCLSIDVEGLDLSVLRSNDWAKFTPRVVCVEELDPVKSEFEQSEIHTFLLARGYGRTAWTVLSSIYVHQDYLELMANS